MKLLFFLINMNLGGTEKSFLNLLAALPKEWEVDVLLLENKGELLTELPPHIKIQIIENQSPINESLKIGSRQFAFQELKRGNFFSFFKNIFAFLLQKTGIESHSYQGISHYIKPLNQQYDFAISYAGIHNFIAYYTLQHIQAKRKIQWIHFDVTKVITDIGFGEKFYPKFDQILCVSENSKQAFVTMFPSIKEKTAVFENIISIKDLEYRSSLEKGFTDGFPHTRIVTLGRLSEEKGQMMIPSVVARLKGEGFQFRWYLIGDGKLRQEIEKEIARLKIENDLVLLGAQLNPYPYLKNCDIFVLSSFYEGYPVVLLEAKVFNKPVVTTHFLSADNLITDGVDGLIVEISEEGIYQGVRKLLNNPDLIKDYSISTSKSHNVTEKLLRLFSLEV